MNLKTVLATSICFLVLGIAAAQSYTVRVTYNTDLREFLLGLLDIKGQIRGA